MRTNVPSDRGDDTGATMIWVALLSIVIFGMASFAVDAGLGFTVKRKLSATADSAALAGAMEAANTYNGGCDNAAIDAAVQQNHGANLPPDSAVAVTEVQCPDATGGITVIVNETSTHPTIFGRILGTDTMTPGASAAARITGTSLAAGMRPWTICLEDALAAYNDGSRMMVSFYVKDTGSTDQQVGCLPSGASRAGGYASFNDSTGSTQYIVCLIEEGYGNCPGDSPTYDVGSPSQYEPFPAMSGTDDRATNGAYAQGDSGHSAAASDPIIDAVHVLLGEKNMTMDPETILLPTAEYWEKNEGTYCSGAPGVQPGCYEGFGAIRAHVHGYWFDAGRGGSSFSTQCQAGGVCAGLRDALLAQPAFSPPNPKPYFMIFWKYAGPNWVSKVDLTAAPGNLCFDEALCNIAAGLVPVP